MSHSRTKAARWVMFAAAIAAIATALILLTRARTPLDTSSTGDVQVAPQPVAPELLMPAERDGMRLAPVAIDRSLKPVDMVEAIAMAGVPKARPVSGKYRIMGRVTDVEDRPFDAPGAVVRVYGESDTGQEDSVLGTATVSASGHYWIDLRRSRRKAAVHDSTGWVWARLVAPGYESADAGADLEDAEGGVLTINLETLRGGLLVKGRIVDRTGAPVPDARVVSVQWGPNADAVQNEDLQTESDGRFDFGLISYGWIDVVAVHPSLGVVKAGGRLNPGENLFDFGDLVLEERGVVSGIVRGYGGDPIASYFVSLSPVVDDDFVESHDAVSDAQGRFRFANLDEVAYHVTHEFTTVDLEESPIVRPGTTGYVVKVEHPTARVTIVNPDGIPITAENFVCRFVPNAASTIEHRWVDVTEAQPGVHRLLFEGPGKFAIGAHIHVDGRRWSATRLVDIGREHLEIKLRLVPNDGQPVRFIVHESGGQPAAGWRASITDPGTKIRADRVSQRNDTAPVMPGTWTLRVESRAPSTFLPFTASFTVPREASESPLEIHVRARENGGRLRLSVAASDGYAVAMIVARVLDENGSLVGADTKWLLDGKEKDFTPILSRGNYTLELQQQAWTMAFGGTPMGLTDFVPGLKTAMVTSGKVQIAEVVHKHPFTIRAGEATHLDLAFP